MPHTPIKILLLLLLVAALSLPACLPKLDPGPPPARLRLNPALPGKLREKPLNKQIIVSLPQADGDIDTDRIALIYPSREVRYLSGARWAGTMSALFQRDLMAALQSTNALRGVVDDTAGIAADVRLLSDIRLFALEQDAADGPLTAVFAGTFRLIDIMDGKVLATRLVEFKVPAAGKETALLTKAMESVLEKTLAEVSVWVVETLR